MERPASTPSPATPSAPTRGRLRDVLWGGVAVLVSLSGLGCAREAASGRLETARAAAEEEAVADPRGGSEPAESPTTAVPVTTTTTVDPLEFAPVVHDGEGDTVLDVTAIADKPGLVHAVFTGSFNNVVWVVDGNGQQIDLLVNAIGPYDGTTLLSESVLGTPTHLQVQATGGWHIEIVPLSQVTRVAGPHAGTGDAVFFTEQPGIATFTHDGSLVFTVWAHGERRLEQLIVNAIGAYSGQVIVPGPEGALIEITADGNWSYTPTG
jgi:hypothetical protein